MTLVFLANLITTMFMTGVIWIVQVVHCPLFSRVGGDVFRPYMEAQGGGWELTEL